jgi:hypothetical protein
LSAQAIAGRNRTKFEKEAVSIGVPPAFLHLFSQDLYFVIYSVSPNPFEKADTCGWKERTTFLWDITGHPFFYDMPWIMKKE